MIYYIFCRFLILKIINKSMNKKQQQLFIAFFDQIIETEEALDLIKTKLTHCPGYNPLLLFRMLAIGGEVITISQMRMYMLERMGFNERELYDIFERFDWERQGTISRRDFLREMTPFNYRDGQLDLIGGSLNAEIEGLFISLLIEIIKRFRILQVSRKEVLLIPPYDAFAYLDPMKTGILGLNQLNKFFVHNDFRVTSTQLNLLLHGLRRRAYLEINLEVFCENITPLQFGQYEGYARAIQKDRQKDILSRSRCEQQTIKRSRVESQKAQHQVMKVERRRLAELQRHADIESRVNAQILSQQVQRERLLRKAVLEEDRRLRIAVQGQMQNLQQKNLRVIAQTERNAELAAIEHHQRQVNHSLARSALLRQREIDTSRRQFDYERELALRQQIERDKQVRRLASHAHDLQQSRRAYEYESHREKDIYQRQLQLDRIRQMESNKFNRFQEIQKELSKTRTEMKQRRDNLERQEKSRRQQMTDSRKDGPPTQIGSITKSYYV